MFCKLIFYALVTLFVSGVIFVIALTKKTFKPKTKTPHKEKTRSIWLEKQHFFPAVVRNFYKLDIHFTEPIFVFSKKIFDLFFSQ